MGDCSFPKASELPASTLWSTESFIHSSFYHKSHCVTVSLMFSLQLNCKLKLRTIPLFLLTKHILFFLFNMYLFIWLCQVLVASCGIFVAGHRLSGCGMQAQQLAPVTTTFSLLCPIMKLVCYKLQPCGIVWPHLPSVIQGGQMGLGGGGSPTAPRGPPTSQPQSTLSPPLGPCWTPM